MDYMIIFGCPKSSRLRDEIEACVRLDRLFMVQTGKATRFFERMAAHFSSNGRAKKPLFS